MPRYAALAVACAAVPACDLVDDDLYAQRRSELEPHPTWAGDASGVLVRVLDPFGQPAGGVGVRVNGAGEAVTDSAGLAWVAAEGRTVLTIDGPSLNPPMAATGAVAVAATGYAGLTLELVPERSAHLDDGVGAINETGVRSLAFPRGAFDAAVPVTVPWAWADGRAPPADDLDVLRAVWLGTPDGAGLVGSATWRVQRRGADPYRYNLGLYRFDADSGAWVRAPGDIDSVGTWLEAELDEPGAWYAMAAPVSASCAPVEVVDAGSGAPLAGAEVRVALPDRDAPRRAVTDGDGVACAGEALGDASVGVLRGSRAAAGPTAWFVPASERSLVAGQRVELEVSARVDGDGDGLLSAPAWDCDDADPRVGRGAPDSAGDGVDQDCDGVDGVDHDRDGDPRGSDCDDADPTSAHGLPERCDGDGRDNDCDGANDPGDCLRCTPQAIADLRPILYFPLDDLDGQHAADGSGWGRDLAVTGNLTERWPGVAHWDAGTPYWNGDLGSFLWLEDEDGAWPAQELSVSVWIRPEYANRVVVSYQSHREPYADAYAAAEPTGDCDAAGYSDDVACDPDDLQLWEFYLKPQVQGTIAESADVRAAFRTVVPLRRWSHLVVVRHAGVASLYLDGDLVEDDVPFTCENEEGQAVPLGTCLDRGPLDMLPGGVLRIGEVMESCPSAGDGGDAALGDMSGVKAFEGVLDEIAIFDRALSAEEVFRLFEETTCGEGLACDARDDDLDGVVDEHLVGTADCPATGDACAQVDATDSELREGPYTIDVGDGPISAWCSDGAPAWCGDGARAELAALEAQESCDPSDPAAFPAGARTCDDCVAEVPWLRDCQDVLDHDKSAPSGAYRVDLDGKGPHPPVTVRCDMDPASGEGWTEVFRHDTRAGVLFNDPRDAWGQCASREACADAGDNDGDGLVDCADPECWTAAECASVGVLPENLLCPDPRDEVAEAYCGCGCPSRVSGDNTSCLGPLGSKFSLVAYLDALHEGGGLVQYRLRWPFHEDTIGAAPLQWCQEWLPTELPASRAAGWCFDPAPIGDAGEGFAGLAPHGPDDDCDPATHSDTYPFAAFDGVEETDRECSGLFAVGTTRRNGRQDAYGVPASPAFEPDGTSKTVELWVRRVTEAGQCPSPCVPP